ncbi:chitinase [Streptomyces diastaticus]|uniref:chitinase n=1 Tax=Streptomyces diastaticus TaxID=1956 RepID=UPI0013B68D8F|nr:chitinase [Streptomyces sp. SID7982]NEE58283.1 chitinase [Streptomyces sp. SID8455]
MSRRGTPTVAAVLAAVAGLVLTLLSGPAAAHDRHRPHHSPRPALPVSERQFERMFPERDPFFTYQGLREAAAAFPAFARTGNPVVRRQEAAAFLANVSHETGGLFYKVAQNEETYPVFCDTTQPYGCPAGTDAYYGRGAIMLSWNFNYKAAGDHLGLDLLNNPWLVEEDPAVAWMTALWYWTTQSGPGTMTGHEAMTGRHGFGETVRSLNGSAECDGGNPAQMEHRVALYKEFTRVLHAPRGTGLTC